MDDLLKLVPSLADWSDYEALDLTAWVEMTGNYELSVGYATLFWPEFAVFGPYILRARAFSPETVAGFERQTGGDRRAVEAVINHLHLADIHRHDEANDSQLRFLGSVLKACHSAKLKHDFPDRKFTVSLEEESETDGFSDFVLTFWQD